MQTQTVSVQRKTSTYSTKQSGPFKAVLMSIDGWIPDIPLEERSPSHHVTR